MKIDHEYLKGLLEAFEASEEPHTDIPGFSRHQVRTPRRQEQNGSGSQ